MTTNTTASIDLAQLDSLEALARAADPTGAMHLSSHYRLSADLDAEEAWRRAANPATVQQLIALARRSLTSGAPAEPMARIDIVDGLPNRDTMFIDGAKLGSGIHDLYAGPVHDAAAPSNGDLDALVREYGNAPVIGPGRTRRVVMREIYQLAGEIFGEAGAAAKTDHDRLSKQSADLLRKGLRDWETPENRYVAQRVLDAIEATAAGAGEDPIGDFQRAAREAKLNEMAKGWTEGAAGAGSDQVAAFKSVFHSAHRNGAGYDEAVAAGLSAAARASVTVQDERALFDAWCIRKGYSTNKWHDGGYVDSNTQNGWEVWQARAAHPVQDGEKDAQRYRVLRMNVDSLHVKIPMTKAPPSGQTIQERIDFLCDLQIDTDRAAMAAAQKGGAA